MRQAKDMNGKKRINNILRKKRSGALCWTTLLEPQTIKCMPGLAGGLSPLEFYRHIGCDIMQFGTYGLDGTSSPCRLRQPDAEIESTGSPDGSASIITRSRWGTLTAVSQNGHPVKYPLETI